MPTTKNTTDLVNALMDEVNKKHGPGTVSTLAGAPIVVERLTSGQPDLDEVLGGGIPKGRIVELVGNPADAWRVVLWPFLRALPAEMTAMVVDVRHGLVIGPEDVELASRLLVAQPDSGESALEVTAQVVKSGAVDVVVIDCSNRLTPEAAMVGDGSTAGLLSARLLSQALRLLCSQATRSGTTILFLTEPVEGRGVTFGASTYPLTGGNALKFYSSLRAELRTVPEDECRGGPIEFKVVKNKTAPPFRSVFL